MELLSAPTEGIPIWHPTEDGDIGDLGYFDETGYWVKVSVYVCRGQTGMLTNGV
jgi:hypothetical protein